MTDTTALIERAKAIVNAMSPDERAAHFAEQRANWAKAESELSRLEAETTVVGPEPARAPFTADENRAAEIEAAREEGFHAGLTAARHVAHNKWRCSMSYVEDEPPEDVRIHNHACWAIRDSIDEMLRAIEAKAKEVR